MFDISTIFSSVIAGIGELLTAQILELIAGLITGLFG